MTSSNKKIDSVDDGSPFVSAVAVISLVLSPESVSSPLTHVKRHMNNLLFKFLDDVGGVLLAYSDLSLGSNHARIRGEHPWLYVRVNVKALVFKPFKGLVVPGEVSKVAKLGVQIDS